MEQDVDTVHRKICNTCLSSDRDIIILNEQSDLYQMYRLLTYDFAGQFDPLSEQTLEVCWECIAMLRKFSKFKHKVQTAQEHLRVISESQENTDHTYLSQSLSSLESILKLGYDKIYIDTTAKLLTDWTPHYIEISTSENIKNEQYDIAQVVRGDINLELDDHILGGVIIDSQTTVPHIMINAESLVTETVYKDTEEFVIPELTVRTLEDPKSNELEENVQTDIIKDKPDLKAGYITEYMNEEDMLAFREKAKKKFHYASAVHKCELCIVGFYTQQQVEDHYECAHKAREGTAACKVCYSYVEETRLSQHVQGHYMRHVCRLCGRAEATVRCAQLHVQTHLEKKTPSSLIKIGDAVPTKKASQKRKQKEQELPTNTDAKNLRKLLSKTTIEGYKCLECDMFFKNSRARKSHVARYHREGLECDHCKKRFVNRTTLVTHLKLHEGPPPREECPICHKMVRVIQIKYHIQRHQNKGRYECTDCNKVFSYLTTYQGHLKYSRAHASDQVLKFPCPMCNKGYPTKEAMQDHFNYQHLGKTSHKCPVCEKPIASRANVERHMMRVHGEKKEKPRNHVCQQCGKGFTDKKSLNQHEVIHSGDRPLSCEICHQTFKQKASLYTHRKRVHNVTPAKRVVEFIESKDSAKSKVGYAKS